MHYIFDPTNGEVEDAPEKYWRFLPFHENDEAGRIEVLLETLQPRPDVGETEDRAAGGGLA